MEMRNALRSKSMCSAILWLSCVLLFVVVASDKTRGENNLPLTQNYRGFELSVVSFERAGNSYKARFFEHRASQGEELIVVHMVIRYLDAKEKLEIKRFELHGVNDRKGETSLTSITIPAKPGEYPQKIVFRIHKGTKLKAFQIEDILFDLQ